ncbi:OmpA family protein [Candidatus Enterovibrio escicola]|uniref:Outer membrane protein SypB n=1 Tax=Candidatus Enterovibrio escicola TaxID=1927127 RepID=A0A2A5T3W4_9GAMM|nr:OmpA family protein [Candidatus Enterovibrio escacola]PCS22865.1 Outer membrane protein SypB [Candidatus Enterovibrio escacola]
MKNILTLILYAILISGCSFFPDHGEGGMAEYQYSSLSPVMPSEPLEPKHGLRFEWKLAAHHLDILVLEGAERCFPAMVILAKRMQDRIVRELQGGLNLDAANDLIIQRTTLERLEKQLDAIQGSSVCISLEVVDYQSTADLAVKIYGLLNTDNQFAFNSYAVNPKYMNRLAEAATLLHDLTQYNLHITGHADIIGSIKFNQELSLARANQVKRYLQIFGITPSRLSVTAVGSSDPLLEGSYPHIRLTNRRVSIELIKTDTHDKIVKKGKQ